MKNLHLKSLINHEFTCSELWEDLRIFFIINMIILTYLRKILEAPILFFHKEISYLYNK